jgi:predicted GIY-YIG superfamily endonuclease
LKAPIFLYFARDEESGYIKIGVSRAPMRRLAEHERRSLLGRNRRITLLSAVRCDEQPFAVENDLLQRRFKHLQVRGEWMRPGDELLAFIRSQAP